MPNYKRNFKDIFVCFQLFWKFDRTVMGWGGGVKIMKKICGNKEENMLFYPNSPSNPLGRQKSRYVDIFDRLFYVKSRTITLKGYSLSLQLLSKFE